MADASRPMQATRLGLPALALSAAEDLGRVDMISAGAISTNCLYTLLRMPGLVGRFRIIDDDAYATTNLNRYPLMRRFMIGQRKAQAVSGWTNGRLNLVPLVARFDERTASRLGPLASHVLVGVDNIRSRWAAQVAADDWLSVTGTSDFRPRLRTRTRRPVRRLSALA
jgi:molybdopterin/thiamine biosynthesis adenylyltransferase